jgi:hypothetical protein
MSTLIYLFRGRQVTASPEWGQNLDLAAGAIQEAICRMFERVAKILMA